MPEVDTFDFRFIKKQYESGKIKGWQPDYEFTQRENPFDFSLVARNLYVDTLAAKKDTFLYRPLWEVLKKLNPNYKWISQYQKRGTCVGQGHKLGADDLMAISSVLGHTEFKGRCCVAANYAGGRVDIAGKSGSWDGSNGIWNVKFLKNYGVLLLKDVELPEDAMNDDEQLAIKWCKSKEGVPENYEKIAKEHPVQDYAMVTNFEDAGVAIQNGYPVSVCSGQGFSSTRDSDGFSKPSGSWSHCMLFWAVRWDKPGLLCQNSWANNWNKGPKWPEDQPDGSFWVEASVATKMLRQNDSFALSNFKGWPKQDLDFRFHKKNK
jgi:hypothetical protein